MKNILIKSEEFEKRLGIVLEPGLNNITVVLTQKECEEFNKTTKINVIFEIIKAIDNKQYSLILKWPSVDGQGAKKYERTITRYLTNIINDSKIDVEQYVSSIKENTEEEIVTGISRKSYLLKKINLFKTSSEKIRYTDNKIDFYTSTEHVIGIQVTWSYGWKTLFDDKYIKFKSGIYRGIENTTIFNLNEKHKKVILSGKELFVFAHKIEQVNDIISINDCPQIYYKNNRIYKLENKNESNFTSEYYTLISGELEEYAPILDKELLDYSNDIEINPILKITRHSRYDKDREVCNLNSTNINNTEYIVTKLIDTKNTLPENIELFFHDGNLYAILCELNEFCFKLDGYLPSYYSIKSDIYGHIKEFGKRCRISKSATEFLEIYKNTNDYDIVLYDTTLLDYVFPELIGKTVRLKEELTNTSSLIGISGEIVSQEQNRQYVTVEYFGHFREDMHISKLEIE